MPPKKNAFEKRIKRRIIARTQEFFVVCAPGLTGLCRREMENMGEISSLIDTIPTESMEVIPGGIAFKGSIQNGYAANLMLRSPSRVLMRVGQFRAENFRTLEKKLQQMEWELYLENSHAVQCDVATRKSRLYHKEAIAQRVMESIQHRFESLGPLETTDKREAGAYEKDVEPLPSPRQTGDKRHLGHLESPPQTILIRGENDHFEISLDSSGDLLHKRGIKSHGGAAPLRETLAFALIDAADYTPGIPFIDGMCGSGTFSLEAAMISRNIPPGHFRSFAFEGWPCFSPGQWRFMKNALSRKVLEPSPSPTIFAMDQDGEAITRLEKTLQRSDLSTEIDARQGNFFDINPGAYIDPGSWIKRHPCNTLEKKSHKGLVLLNPPYGKRIGERGDADKIYLEIGKKLSSDFKGWRAGIIFPDKSLVQGFPSPKKWIPLFHGGLDLHGGIFQL